jgi:hypothetical protein
MSRKTRTYNRDVHANMRGVTSSHWGKTCRIPHRFRRRRPGAVGIRDPLVDLTLECIGDPPATQLRISRLVVASARRSADRIGQA